MEYKERERERREQSPCLFATCIAYASTTARAARAEPASRPAPTAFNRAEFTDPPPPDVAAASSSTSSSSLLRDDFSTSLAERFIARVLSALAMAQFYRR